LLNYNQNILYSTDIDDTEGKYPINLIATEVFGRSKIIDEEVLIESGESVIDAIKKVATVTTTYGGGYLESINGIKSNFNTKNDWFYYINGMLASVGASMYKPHEGDIVHWDFHDWSSDRIITAIIGNYPEPFLHGFNGKIADTNIVFSEDFYDTAILLKESLEKQGVLSSLLLFEDLTTDEKKNKNIILIDTYENELIKELNENANQLGWFIEYDKKNIVTYDEKGKKDDTYDHGGVICATSNIWNPKGNWHCDNVIWVITGIDNNDVIEASNLLIEYNNEIKNYASIIIDNGTVHKVP